MTKCYNCGEPRNILLQLSSCGICSTRINLGEGTTPDIGVLCPQHRNIVNDYHLKIRSLVQILGISLDRGSIYKTRDERHFKLLLGQIKDKWEQKIIIPETQQSELLTENRQLTTNLTLKDKELADLQAQIRALNSQLTEKENNSPFQIKINKLERILNSVKSKLTHWIKLLKKDK